MLSQLKLFLLKYKIIFASVFLLIVGAIGYQIGYNLEHIKFEKYKIENTKLINDLERKTNKINEKLVVQYVDKVRTITEKQYLYKDKIREVKSNCPISNSWVDIHNSSAGQTIPPVVVDNDISDITDVKALETVTENYSICEDNAQKLKALQEWIVKTQAEVKKLNEGKK